MDHTLFEELSHISTLTATFRSKYGLAEVKALWEQFLKRIKEEGTSDSSLAKYVGTESVDMEDLIFDLESYDFEEHNGKIVVFFLYSEPFNYYPQALLAEFISTVIAEDDETTLDFCGCGAYRRGYHVRRDAVKEIALIPEEKEIKAEKLEVGEN
jgi:hypothetical protein